MICHDCRLGQEKRVVGDGITEPPYIFLVHCPFDNKYFKNWDDECCHEDERKRKEGEMNENCGIC